MTRIVIATSLVLLGAVSSFADIAAVRSVVEYVLSEQGEPRVSKADLVGLHGDDVKNAPQEEARSLLALAQRCLQSRSKTAQEYGLIVFYLATFRTDSSELIAPYVDSDITPFLSDPDLAVKRNAIMILGTTQPRPLPGALDLLSTHLADKNNTELEAGMIIATLIHGRPADTKTVNEVLDFVSNHPELKLRASAIQLLALNNVTVDEAVKYLRGGLVDQNSEVRRTSVEAIGHMPPEIRAKFKEDLLRLLANPEETQEARAAAQRALQQ